MSSTQTISPVTLSAPWVIPSTVITGTRRHVYRDGIHVGGIDEFLIGDRHVVEAGTADGFTRVPTLDDAVALFDAQS